MTLVFLDLDGTIVGPDGSVSDAVFDAVERAKSVGFDFRVCTGRTCAGVAEEIAYRLNPKAFHIFESGAVGIVPRTRRVLFADTLDIEDAQRLVSHSRSVDAVLELYTTAGAFADERTDDGDEHARCLKMSYEARDLDDVLRDQVVLRGHWIAREGTFEPALSVDLPNSHVARAGSPALPQMRFASVTRAGVSKGTAVARLISESQADREACVGVGDTVGDVPMLDAVGRPFVVRNSPQSMLERYSVIGSVEEDGVVSLLDRLICER